MNIKLVIKLFSILPFNFTADDIADIGEKVLNESTRVYRNVRDRKKLTNYFKNIYTKDNIQDEITGFKTSNGTYDSWLFWSRHILEKWKGEMKVGTAIRIRRKDDVFSTQEYDRLMKQKAQNDLPEYSKVIISTVDTFIIEFIKNQAYN